MAIMTNVKGFHVITDKELIDSYEMVGDRINCTPQDSRWSQLTHAFIMETSSGKVAVLVDGRYPEAYREYKKVFRMKTTARIAYRYALGYNRCIE